MPFTFGAFCVASFSIIGLPPLGGAWSKWYLVSGAFDAGQTLMGLVFMASSLLSIGYLMPIVVRAFFRPLPAGEEEGVREIPMLMLLPICATALGCLLIFFYADAAYRLLAPVVGLAG